jgi:hypothetical protein
MTEYFTSFLWVFLRVGLAARIHQSNDLGALTGIYEFEYADVADTIMYLHPFLKTIADWYQRSHWYTVDLGALLLLI